MDTKKYNYLHSASLVVAVLLFVGIMCVNAQEKKTPSDRERLIGSWYAARLEMQGEADTRPLKDKLVITQEALSLVGGPEEYRLDEKRTPKQLDFGIAKGIYKLDGDKLVICTTTSSSAKTRPTEFKTTPEDELWLWEFRRAKEIPKDAPDREFDKSLKTAIAIGVTLLDARRDEEFIRRFIPPEQLKQFGDSKLKEIVDNFGSKRLELLSTLRVLIKLHPEVRKDKLGTIALFDLSRIHIPNGTWRPTIVFIKIGDNWHLVDRQ